MQWLELLLSGEASYFRWQGGWWWWWCYSALSGTESLQASGKWLPSAEGWQIAWQFAAHASCLHTKQSVEYVHSRLFTFLDLSSKAWRSFMHSPAYSDSPSSCRLAPVQPQLCNVTLLKLFLISVAEPWEAGGSCERCSVMWMDGGQCVSRSLWVWHGRAYSQEGTTCRDTDLLS